MYGELDSIELCLKISLIEMLFSKANTSLDMSYNSFRTVESAKKQQNSKLLMFVMLRIIYFEFEDVSKSKRKVGTDVA